eukprot:snap_masked-scaffold_40-processed-gene-0.29-mRNA-1 protein AED:1.00 eAED:1.00 QI:0/-1/0/0/-1/1/1/0/309
MYSRTCGANSETTELGEYLSKFTVDDVILNRLKYPFTRENFRSFLKERVATENLEFIEEVEKLIPKPSRSTWKLANLPSISSRKNIEAQSTVLSDLQLSSVVDDFIVPGSPREINISAKLRNSVLDMARDQGEKKVDITLFDDCVDEVKNLLQLGHLTEFLHTVSTRNTNKKECRKRRNSSLLMLTLFFLSTFSVFSLLLLENDTIEEIHLELRLIPCIFFMFAIQELYAWKYGFCPMLAAKGAAMKVDDKKNGYKLIFCCERSDDRRVKDEVVSRYSRKHAAKVFIWIVMLTMFVGCLLLLIPPTPLI